MNATHLLKVAGFVDKAKRTKVLEKEIHCGVHEKIQGGYGRYQGTWVPWNARNSLPINLKSTKSFKRFSSVEHLTTLSSFYFFPSFFLLWSYLLPLFFSLLNELCKRFLPFPLFPLFFYIPCAFYPSPTLSVCSHPLLFILCFSFCTLTKKLYAKKRLLFSVYFLVSFLSF
ncbi:hypothetical protein BC829DRAFT_119227 [Chytridium lagenaria]|nr:hypothetical protein BC829DRAFT_119227 [Chytridium lagenaria]